MLDPAKAQVEIYMLHRDNEEMMGYMLPNKAVQQQIKNNCTRIAYLALTIYNFYSQSETQLTPKQARSSTEA